MMEKQPKCGFLVRKTFEGLKDFDQTYKESSIKRRVKKIGDGDEDYIIEEFEEIVEVPIREVIDAQVDSVGVEAFIRPYQLAGQPLPDVAVGDEVQDFTNMPEDPADAIAVGDRMVSLFNGLDPELRGEASSVEEFLNSLTKEKIDAYIASKLNIEKGNEDVK